MTFMRIATAAAGLAAATAMAQEPPRDLDRAAGVAVQGAPLAGATTPQPDVTDAVRASDMAGALRIEPAPPGQSFLILNGKLAERTPWQVQLFRAKREDAAPTSQQSQMNAQRNPRPDWMRRHVCGGVLIAAGWVMTAGHCVGDGNDARLRVRAGTADIEGESGAIRKIAQIIRHPLYAEDGDKPPRNDVALLRLAKPLPRGNPFAIATLPLLGDDGERTLAAGAWVTLTGWGATANAERPPMAPKLLAADLVIVSRAVCNAQNGWSVNTPGVSGDAMCAADPRSGGVVVGPCVGDSGGPLVVVVGGKRRIAGLASWAPRPCDEPDRPTVFADVRALRGWIRSIVAAP